MIRGCTQKGPLYEERTLHYTESNSELNHLCCVELGLQCVEKEVDIQVIPPWVSARVSVMNTSQPICFIDYKPIFEYCPPFINANIWLNLWIFVCYFYIFIRLIFF